jgi:hypothetical protein
MLDVYKTHSLKRNRLECFFICFSKILSDATDFLLKNVRVLYMIEHHNFGFGVV